MAKKLLNAPPAEGAITTYVSELSGRLRRSAVGGERADEIIQEAEAHLRDHADALRAGGLGADAAESLAVGAFVPPTSFARDMAQSVFARWSVVWCGAGFVVNMGVLALTLYAMTQGVTGLVLMSWCHWEAIPTLAVFAPLVAGFAFAARRAQTRRLVCAGLAATVATFFYTGFWYVDSPPGCRDGSGWPRSSAVHISRIEAEDAASLAAQRRVLDEGSRVYQAASPVVPASLRRGTGYVVPAPYATRWNVPARYITSIRNIALAPQAVPTLAQAQARWRADGTKWAAWVGTIQDACRTQSEPTRLALLQTGFRWRAAVWNARQTLTVALWLLVLDGLAARVSQQIYLRRRKRSRRQRA